MLSRLPPLLRTLHPPVPASASASTGDSMAARVFSRGLPSPALALSSSTHSRRSRPAFTQSVSFSSSSSSVFGRWLSAVRSEKWRGFGKVFASQRGFRKARGRKAKSGTKKEKELGLDVTIGIEEQLPDDPEILAIAEMLRLNVPKAMTLAFNGLKGSDYKTRDPAIDDVGCFESVELSVLLCNDEFIRKLNKDWRNEDHATDVLSMSQHMPELKLPILMLGDIIISVETAAKQAEERGHTLLDEIRILVVG